MPKLDKKFTEKCGRCKHGKAAHKLGVATEASHCRMKYCKCTGFTNATA